MIKRIFKFDRMLTPVIIKVVYWVGLITCVLAGVILFFAGIIMGIVNGEIGQVIGGLIGGPVVIILGVLGVRIYAELLILMFQINDTLTDIKDLLSNK